jgi:hypothetical protein
MRRAVSVAFLVLSVAVSALAGDLKPPLLEMAEHTDAGKTVSIQLPRNWRAEGARPGLDELQRWSGFIQQPKPGQPPDAWVHVALLPTWSRLELAYWGALDDEPGRERVPDSVRRGEGWIEEVRENKQKQTHYLVRTVEADGRVYVLAAYAHDPIWVHIDDHMRAILDTFKALSKPPLAVIPAGYAKSVENGLEVWTDTKDKTTLKRILGVYAASRAAMTAALPGEPAVAEPPIVVVCDKDAAFTALTKDASPQINATGMIVYKQRLFATRVGGKSNAMFDDSTARFAAMQYLQYHFGGKGPDWVDWGLALWGTAGFATKGKPEKPPAEYVRSAKSFVPQRKESLATLIDIRRETLPVEKYESFDLVAYAWHCFFRIGAGAAEYGERYRGYLDELRRSGSPDEAKKAWDGADMAKMQKEFEAWVAGWKP